MCLETSQKDALTTHDMGMGNTEQENQVPGLERSTFCTRQLQQQLNKGRRKMGDLVTHGTILSPDI